MKTVIFDFDGTLADTFEITVRLVNRIGRYYRIPYITDEEIEKYRHIGLRALMKKFNISKPKMIAMATHVRLLLRKELDSLPLFDGVREMLQQLNNDGYQLYIYSSNSKRNIEQVLRREEVDIFRRIFTERSLTDKAVGLEKMVTECVLAKDDVVYIGDEVRDVEACMEVGIDIIAVSWGFNSREGLIEAGAKVVVDDAEELAEAIRGLSSSK